MKVGFLFFVSQGIFFTFVKRVLKNSSVEYIQKNF